MIDLEIQRLVDDPGVPSDEQIAAWVNGVLADQGPIMVNLRIVDLAEGWALNKQWRGRDCATNVLSFPASAPQVEGQRVLGDVVLCAPVITREAAEQGKAVSDHWAHLVIHGLLHLLGFDHTQSEQAQVMEAREVELLSALGMPNPYETEYES
jgi:probable rRNA maturation factor